MKKFLSNPSDLIIGLAVCFLIYGNLAWTDSGIFGLILIFGWLAIASKIIKNSIIRIFSVESWISSAIGCCLSIFLFGFAMNFCTAWLKFNDLTAALSLAFVLLLLSSINYWLAHDQSDNEDFSEPIGQAGPEFPKWLAVVFVIISAWAYQLISASTTGKYLTSPWQTINPWYILAILLLSAIAYAAIFLRKKISVSLAVIIIFSIIIHCYLLVFQAGFGGDRWRHLGSEYRLLGGMEQSIAQKWQPMQELAGVRVPKALINSAQLSYGFNWSLSAVISKLINVDVYFLDQYLMLLLWSAFLPLIFFVGAKQIKNDNAFALLAAVLPGMLFILQYYGSLTLPSSYGALYFALMAMFWLAYRRRPSKKLLALNLFLTFFSYLGYTLMFALNVLMAALVFVLNLKSKLKYLLLMILGSAIFIAEWLSPYNEWHWQFINREFIHRLFYNNILFFDNGLIRSMNFSGSRYYFLLLSVLFIALIIFSLIKFWKSKNPQQNFLAWLFAIIAGNYLLSWYLLDGTHILSRRLDVFAGIVLVWLFAYVLSYNISKANKAFSICLAILILSVITVLNYISGPVLAAAVTTDEVAAVRLIRQQMGDSYMDYCVLANTWPLLVFETYTYREMAAGNFPMDYNHQQPERVRLFAAAINNPSFSVLDEAKSISGKDRCFLMINQLKLSSTSAAWLQNNLGRPAAVGDNLIWKF